jgi:hypothetical protein
MNSREGETGMEAQRISVAEQAAEQRREEAWKREEFFADILESGPPGEVEYGGIEEECRRQGLNRWQLWEGLAVWDYPAQSLTTLGGGLPVGEAEQERMRRRILGLIGRLPQGSKEEFIGLVRLMNCVQQRVEFLCEMMVYLFAEREKGREEGGGEVEGKRYTEYFCDKLMWDLSKIQDLGGLHSLAVVEQEYRDWLVDLLMSGEVLV